MSLPRASARFNVIARFPRLHARKMPLIPFARAPDVPGVVARAGRLDLDDVGALVGEDRRRERTRDHRREVDDPDAGQRPAAHARRAGRARRAHATSQRPRSISTVPRWVTVRKAAAGPSTQISVVSVSPGWPGLENRPSIERNRTGSSAQSRVEQRAPGEAHRAQAHQDRPVEAGDLREPRVGVDPVVVARGDPVEQRLGRRRLVRDGVVGCAIGGDLGRSGCSRAGLRRVAAGAAVAAEAALAAEEERRAGAEPRLPSGGVDRVPLGDDQRARALVVDAGDPPAHTNGARDRDRAGALDALVAVHDALERDVAELVEGEARTGDPDPHRERREDAQRDALGVLGHELELVPAAPERQRVEHHVVGGPRLLPRPVLAPDDGQVDPHGRPI